MNTLKSGINVIQLLENRVAANKCKEIEWYTDAVFGQLEVQ